MEEGGDAQIGTPATASREGNRTAETVLQRACTHQRASWRAETSYARVRLCLGAVGD